MWGVFRILEEVGFFGSLFGIIVYLGNGRFGWTLVWGGGVGEADIRDVVF